MIELIDFHADWCHPCRVMEPIVGEIEKEHGDKVKVTRIDVDKHPGQAQAYSVLSIPTFVIKKDGQVVEQFAGTISKQGLLKKLGL